MFVNVTLYLYNLFEDKYIYFYLLIKTTCGIKLNMQQSASEIEVIIKQRLSSKLNSEQLQDIYASKSPSAVVRALLQIDQVGFLDVPDAHSYADMVLNHPDPYSLSIIFIFLNKSFQPGLISPFWHESFFVTMLKTISSTDNLQISINILQQMLEQGLLDDLIGGYQDFIFLSAKPMQSYYNLKALKVLLDAGVLYLPNAQYYRNVVYEHVSPISAAEDLVRLNQLGFLRKEKDFTFVRKCKSPGFISRLLMRMRSVGLLPNQLVANYYFNELKQKGKTKSAFSTFNAFVEMGFLDNIDVALILFPKILKLDSSSEALFRLCIARSLGLFDVTNNDANINAHHAMQFINSSIFYLMYEMRIRGVPREPWLVQIVFNKLCHYKVVLLDDNFLYNLITRIPFAATFNYAHWFYITEICRQNLALPMDLVRGMISEYINQQVIAPFIPQGTPNVYQEPQNTHKASVHLCSSQSALRLQEGYQHKITGQNYVRERLSLFKFVSDTPNYLNKVEYPNIDDPSWIPRAAQAFLQRLPSISSSPDPVSGVYLDKLVILIWVAIHDHATRISKLEDAKYKMLEAMFESQRNGNNTSANNTAFIDNMGNHEPACPSGAFNKFIEKLVSIHPSIIWMFIAHQGATDKLFREIPTEIKKYLHELNVTSAAQIPTQENIVAVVKQRLKVNIFFEYGSLYIKNEQDLLKFNQTLVKYDTLAKLELVSEDFATFNELLQKNQTSDFIVLLDSIEYFDIDTVVEGYLVSEKSEESQSSIPSSCY